MTDNEKKLAAHRDWLKQHRMRLYKLTMYTLKEVDDLIEVINQELRRSAHRRKAEENAQQGLGL